MGDSLFQHLVTLVALNICWSLMGMSAVAMLVSHHQSGTNSGPRGTNLDQEYIDRACPIFLLSFSCFIQQLLMSLINLSGKFKFKAMIWTHWQSPYRRRCWASIFKGVLGLLIRCLWLREETYNQEFVSMQFFVWLKIVMWLQTGNEHALSLHRHGLK